MDFDLSLYLVTDSRGFNEQEFLERIDAAICGGVTMVQLREKERDSRALYDLAVKVLDICRNRHVPLLIDDRADIALAAGADGVHAGASDLPVDVLRNILGEKMIIGATAKTVEWALREQRLGADYLGVGAVYPTKTKTDAAGIEMTEFRRICDNTDIPVTAIGGLNYDNIDILRGSGADGIAAVSAIMKSEDPQKAARLLRSKIKYILEEKQ